MAVPARVARPRRLLPTRRRPRAQGEGPRRQHVARFALVYGLLGLIAAVAVAGAVALVREPAPAPRAAAIPAAAPATAADQARSTTDAFLHAVQTGDSRKACTLYPSFGPCSGGSSVRLQSYSIDAVTVGRNETTVEATIDGVRAFVVLEPLGDAMRGAMRIVAIAGA
jgi:hypothetical protein